MTAASQAALRQINQPVSELRPSTTARFQKTKILLVDDRPENLLAYQVMLEELGEELVFARSGEEALKLLQSDEFAVVLLDVNMPGLGGFETARRMRENSAIPPTPIIFVTAYIDDMQSAEAYAHGAVDFIQSPAVPAVLRAKVKVFADLFRMREELNRRRHQEVVRESSERIRLVFESSLEAVVTITERGVVTGWNPQSEALFGWKRDEALEQELAELVIPEPYRIAFRRGMKHFLATGEGPLLNRRLELLALRKGGDEIPVELTVSPFRLGDHVEFSAFVRDIRQRKAAEDTIRRYAAELERSNRELDQFAYSASHDLRSPLRAIDQMAGWIMEDHSDKLPPEVQKDLDLIQRRVRRMQTLLDGLLEYARAGRKEGELTEVDTGQLVREIVELLGPPESFVVTCNTPMPALVTHRAPLQQVLWNLIGNGIKHHDRTDGHVVVSAYDSTDCTEFVVQDDGPGIPEQYHDQVFQMFATLQSRDVIEGSGMGLALVRKILESRGGTIRLSSAPGKGSTFQFTWPKSLEGLGHG